MFNAGKKLLNCLAYECARSDKLRGLISAADAMVHKGLMSTTQVEELKAADEAVIAAAEAQDAAEAQAVASYEAVIAEVLGE